MQWHLLLFGVLPVLTFALVEHFADRRQAVLAAIGAAALECAYDSLRLGFVEAFSLGSLLLFVALGWLSLRRDRPALFKLQPACMGLVFAAAFWIHDAVSGSEVPLFAAILEQHVRINEVIPPYQQGYFAGYARTLSKSLPFLLVVHAAWTAYAAVRLSTWGWFHVRVLGFYAMAAALFFVERLLQVEY